MKRNKLVFALVLCLTLVSLCGCSDTAVYTITYDLNGGYSDVTNLTAFNKDTPSFSIVNPERLGHVFVGWSLSSDLSNPIQSVEIIKGSAGSRIYYAVWKLPACTVTLHNESQLLIYTFIQTGGPYEVGTPVEILVYSTNKDISYSIEWTVANITVTPTSSRVDTNGDRYYTFIVLTDLDLTVTAHILGGAV